MIEWVTRDVKWDLDYFSETFGFNVRWRQIRLIERFRYSSELNSLKIGWVLAINLNLICIFEGSTGLQWC